MSGSSSSARRQCSSTRGSTSSGAQTPSPRQAYASASPTLRHGVVGVRGDGLTIEGDPLLQGVRVVAIGQETCAQVEVARFHAFGGHAAQDGLTKEVAPEHACDLPCDLVLDAEDVDEFWR
jgi:hypothetical protein